MSIGITGASGQLGGAVAARLLDVVDAADVVLMSRTVESLSGFAARGVGVRPVDFGDPPSLALAFEGVDSLLLISTDRVGALVGSGLAKDAAYFIASFGRAVREGYLADVTTAVRHLTGRRPTSLDELVRPVEA